MLQRGETGGATRFGMLETIRAFAVERLAASGEVDALRRRHAAYFLAVAETAQKRFHGADGGEELNRLEVEHANLRAALRFFADEADLEFTVRLLGGLDWLWTIRGHVDEWRRWYARLMELARATGASRIRRTCCVCRGGWPSTRATTSWPAPGWKRAWSSPQVEDRLGIARSLAYLGLIARYRGEYALASSLSHEP